MQPDQYKPKTTIIQANPGFWHKGEPVVAWVIEDGQVTKPVVLGTSITPTTRSRSCGVRMNDQS